MKLSCSTRSHHLLTETLAQFCIVGKPLLRFFICRATAKWYIETKSKGDLGGVVAYNRAMRSAKQTLDEMFLEMRWRCLSLAADLDRVERAAGGADLLQS